MDEKKIVESSSFECPKAIIKSLVRKSLKIKRKLSPRAIVKKIMKESGLVDEKWINYTRITLHNNLHIDEYKKVPKEDRVLFIPHCLRDAKNCVASADEEGYHCKKCGKCIIAKIVTEAEKNKMKWYICGGGSQVINIVNKIKPKAIAGIACYNEIQMALKKLRCVNIPILAILLKKAGCIGTEVELEEVSEILNL
jgi:hypothetical protein